MSTPKKPLVGKGEPGVGVPAAEHRVPTKPVSVGKDEQTEVPIRTGPGSGRAGGGATGETTPARDTAAQRGRGEKR